LKTPPEADQNQSRLERGRQGRQGSHSRAVASEFPLRNRAWEEDNRRKVDELSGGKLAYVHVPDTAVGGWLNFNRFYFAQVGKQGALIDERYNHGGEVADYIIDMLKRPLRNCAISAREKSFARRSRKSMARKP